MINELPLGIADAWPITSLPALTVVAPTKVFALFRVSEPPPDFRMLPLPLMMPLRVMLFGLLLASAALKVNVPPGTDRFTLPDQSAVAPRTL